MKIKRALISVSNKDGILDFAKALKDLGVEIISTGGTAKLLEDNNIDVLKVQDLTGFPEILDGRVKTLHPIVHAGILADKNLKSHMDSLKYLKISSIDLVCVNLYPFAKIIANKNCKLVDAIENIDIGGPTMIRAAAKNWQSVAVLTDSDDYEVIINEIKTKEEISENILFNLSAKAFAHTASYDAMISNYLNGINNYKQDIPKIDSFPKVLTKQWNKLYDLRYGENPHQLAAFYKDDYNNKEDFVNYKQLQGKELSYNNIADSYSAWQLAISFKEPACVIVKHNNPCGVAVENNLLDAYKKAFSTDKISAFGGIIAFNKEVDANTLEYIFNNQFLEVLIAPSFTEDALSKAKIKPNVRLLTHENIANYSNAYEIKTISGGILLQEIDNYEIKKDELVVVSKREPTNLEWNGLLFLWKVVKYVKSNAIVIGNHNMTYGIGAGQTSRVDSVTIAIEKAITAGFDLNNSIVASDAFFPFRDGVDKLAEKNISAIIHPGGSIKDEEVIESANEHNIAMVMTKIRHFKH